MDDAGEYQRGYDAGVMDLSRRIEAVLRLIRGDHITPVGSRQIQLVLADSRRYDDERCGR